MKKIVFFTVLAVLLSSSGYAYADASYIRRPETSIESYVTRNIQGDCRANCRPDLRTELVPNLKAVGYDPYTGYVVAVRTK